MVMRKKYDKPKLSVEKLDFSLLMETSTIHVGGTGTLDAKYSSLFFYEDEDEEDDE